MSKAIKEARLAAGLTQAKMCSIIGLPMRTLQGWELGERTPPEYVERLIIEKLERIKCENDKSEKQ